MSSLNQVNLIGRCGRDPETKNLPSGDKVATFSLATSEKWKDKQSGEQMEATEWHRVVFFGRIAEVVEQYVRKGSLVFCSGMIKSRKYNDKDGNEKTVVEVKCHELKLLGGNSDGGGQQQRRDSAPAQRPTGKPAGGKTENNDIPF